MALPDSHNAVARDHGYDRLLLAWDVFIIVLVSINLALILFDTLFIIPLVGDALEAVAPTVHGFYNRTIHENFITIDLAFVAVFLLDVLAGWAVAIYQQRYHRWFFYPFVHWYDVLGCIPLAGFRLLRVLRIISLGFRLQKLGAIDVRGWYVYSVLRKYYDILLEEISDRVVLNVLDGMQDEIRGGGGELPQRVLRDVIEPRKTKLVTTVSSRLDGIVNQAYVANRDYIRGYVAMLVKRAVNDNLAVRGIERLPLLGTHVVQAVDATVTDAVCNVLEEAVAGLSTIEFKQMLEQVTNSVFERLLADEAASEPELQDALVETLELVKEQVAVQQWKHKYA